MKYHKREFNGYPLYHTPSAWSWPLFTRALLREVRSASNSLSNSSTGTSSCSCLSTLTIPFVGSIPFLLLDSGALCSYSLFFDFFGVFFGTSTAGFGSIHSGISFWTLFILRTIRSINSFFYSFERVEIFDQ